MPQKRIECFRLLFDHLEWIGWGQHSLNRFRGISTRTMHQSTTPSLSQIIWPRWASWQFLNLSIDHIFLSVTFGYSLSSEAVVKWQLRRWKLWRRWLTRSHKWTSRGPSRSCWNGTTSALQPEEITSKRTRVSCVVPSIKVLKRKKYGNLSYAPRIYIYIYIYIYMYIYIYIHCSLLIFIDLSIYSSIYLSIYLSICIEWWINSLRYLY